MLVQKHYQSQDRQKHIVQSYWEQTGTEKYHQHQVHLSRKQIKIQLQWEKKKISPHFTFLLFKWYNCFINKPKYVHLYKGLWKNELDDVGHHYFILWKMICIFLQKWPKALQRYKARSYVISYRTQPCCRIMFRFTLERITSPSLGERKKKKKKSLIYTL